MFKIFLVFVLMIASSCKSEVKELVREIITTPISETSHKTQFRELLSKHNIEGNKLLVWVGDSITEQGIIGHGNDIGFTTYIEDIYSRINYVNKGVGGNTTKDILSRIDSITELSADIYFLAVGINDARYNDSRGAVTAVEYRQNISEIIERLEEKGATIILNSIFPSFWQDASSALNMKLINERYLAWNKELKSIAKEKKILFIDSYTPITHFINFTNVERLIPDGVHPKNLGTQAKRLYAESILYDELNKDFYEATGEHFFKLEILDNDKAGYCVMRNISISPNTQIKELFGFSQSVGSNAEDLFDTFDSTYPGFKNKLNQFPLTFLFATEDYPESITTTGKANYLNINRGISAYQLYYSEDALALEDLKHNSWKLISEVSSNIADSVNLLPNGNDKILYQLKVGTNLSAEKISISKMSSEIPRRIWTQNEKPESSRRYDLVFSNGATSVPESLVGVNFGFIIIWEVEKELESIDISSIDSSLDTWTLKKSYDQDAMNNPSHSSWADIYDGNGDEVITF